MVSSKTNKRKKPDPIIVHCATLWSMVDHPSHSREWSLERKIKAVKDAGFEGVMWRPSGELKKLIKKYDLKLFGATDAMKPSEFKGKLKKLQSTGAHYVNVQLADHDTPIKIATKLAVRMIQESDRLGMGAHIEIHRDTSTETPEKLYGIASGYKKATGKLMPITWDHSHPAIIKHLRPNEYSSRLLDHPKLLQRSSLFHCRPFNGHHCQVPVIDHKGRLTPEFQDWIKFTDDMFAMWLEGPQPDGQIWVVPEVGSNISGYNLSNFPSSWEQAKVCHKELDKSWKRALNNWKKKNS